MTRELLNSLLHQQGYEGVEADDDFLRKVQAVIDFYPGTGYMGKERMEKEVAGLVGKFGKQIIRDMYKSVGSRARLLEMLLEDMKEIQKKYEEELRRIDVLLERMERGEE